MAREQGQASTLIQRRYWHGPPYKQDGQLVICGQGHERGDDELEAGAAYAALFTSGLVAIGTTTPVANFQVTNASSNATTTIEHGKSGQTKGVCHKEYDDTGAAVYWYWHGTTIIAMTSANGCASVTGF